MDKSWISRINSVGKVCIMWISYHFVGDKSAHLKKWYLIMLTPRLECIVSHVQAQTAADIGTDHAYVSIELIRSGRAQKVIAADVRKGPLEIAAANINKYGMSGRIETRLGSGISVLNENEADTVIIAGMGGELICDILNADMEKARYPLFILQPMNSQYELRRWLLERGFEILSEDIECEGHRVYNLLEVRYTGSASSFERDIDYHLPVYLYYHPKFRELLSKKQREFLKIIRGLENSKECDYEKLDYYKECYLRSEEIKKCL